MNEKSASMFKLILTLKTSQKIKLAMTGNKEARNILIKESNKMISSSVIKNPRITDSEVVTHSKSRSLSEDLLRMIAANKEWVKMYQVKVGLVSNPKCPVPVALKLLNFLHGGDVANIAKDKNVSSTVQTTAKRRLQQMQKKH